MQLVHMVVGRATAPVPASGRAGLTAFGGGTELDTPGWLSVIRQLLAHGDLLPDPEGHGGLALAPRAGEGLRGAREVGFRRDTPRERGTGRKSAKRAAGLDPDPPPPTPWAGPPAPRL